MLDYVVYKITYTGDKHPPFYIGSTSLKNLESGYRGSVASKKWSKIFRQELKLNPSLYTYEILARFNSREEALRCELKIQRELNVVRSPQYFNEAYATVNGCFGRDVSGSANPMFGKKKSALNIKRISERNRGTVTASSDNGKTWRKITVEEYHKNSQKYITPRGEYSEKTTKATRARVQNGTHHFCNPEVQRKIHDARRKRGVKFTVEGKVSLSKKAKTRMSDWNNRNFHGTDYMWKRCVYLFDTYAISSFANGERKTRKKLIQSWVEQFPDMLGKNKWMCKIIAKFENGWNPRFDKNYMAWVEKDLV